MIRYVGNIELCELIAPDGTPNAMQSMFIILGHWHCLLHVRALLAQKKRGKSEIHQVHDGPPFHSRLRHDEGRLHGHRYGKKPGDKEYYIATRRDASRVSMADFCEMGNSAVE